MSDYVHIDLWSFFRLNINDEQLKTRMLMAVPKKGRLNGPCVSMLERAGIKVLNKHKNEFEIPSLSPCDIKYFESSDLLFIFTVIKILYF